MRPLPAHELVAVWERGHAEHPLERALTLLRAADPTASRLDLARLPLGERNARLLALRAASFGGTARATDRCPTCEATVEFDVSVPQLLAVTPAAPTESPTMSLRPCNTLDLAAAAGCPDADAAVRLLAGRCHRNGEAEEWTAEDEDLSPEAVDHLAERLANLDPLAEILFDLRCPECAHGWQAWFDPAAFLWTEVEAAARQQLQQVDILARTYGWSETDILRLTPFRRQYYLELCGAE